MFFHEGPLHQAVLAGWSFRSWRPALKMLRLCMLASAQWLCQPVRRDGLGRAEGLNRHGPGWGGMHPRSSGGLPRTLKVKGGPGGQAGPGL